MKWITAVIGVLLFLFGSVFAEKPTSYTDIDSETVKMTFNVSVTELQDGDPVIRYYPILIEVYGVVKTPEGASRRVKEYQYFGTASDIPYTTKQIYDMLPVQIKTLFKKLYENALNEDTTSW